jgi:hypothetical protein
MDPMPKRKMLTLTDHAAELLPRLAGKYHDQGTYVSQLIEDAAVSQSRAAEVEQADLAALRQIVADLIQRVELLERNRP